ncbi:MAG: RNA polymerase sigma factor [Spiribacter salinus]|uniref:RNA polymerase sigma factor n=1 Tax=Spiribacter salinus TaxID=1335746 RepID=A0A540VSJ7_9GAMM|nr:MAG: RNA polymerase sigma factor [Spiribacter salinus]TQE99732.1 MAG: RNA polymerase sigma factor [Spiribacter salinus]
MSGDIRDELVGLLPRLRRFAMGLTGDSSEADELVQQACEKALRKQHQWQAGTRLDSWMYRIIQTTRIDNVRSRRNDTASLETSQIPEARDRRSEHAPENQNMLDRVSRILDQLPEDQRAVMVLVAVEERSYQEASKILEIPVGTVMSRLYRARARVQSELGMAMPAGTIAERT